jgi:hypothetical protein
MKSQVFVHPPSFCHQQDTVSEEKERKKNKKKRDKRKEKMIGKKQEKIKKSKVPSLSLIS